MGNLDTLDEESRKVALRYFDVMASPDDVPKRERYVGVVLYSDDKLFKGLPPVNNQQQPGFHEKELAATYSRELEHHQKAAMKHLTDASSTLSSSLTRMKCVSCFMVPWGMCPRRCSHDLVCPRAFTAFHTQ